MLYTSYTSSFCGYRSHVALLIVALPAVLVGTVNNGLKKKHIDSSFCGHILYSSFCGQRSYVAFLIATSLAVLTRAVTDRETYFLLLTCAGGR